MSPENPSFVPATIEDEPKHGKESAASPTPTSEHGGKEYHIGVMIGDKVESDMAELQAMEKFNAMETERKEAYDRHMAHYASAKGISRLFAKAKGVYKTNKEHNWVGFKTGLLYESTLKRLTKSTRGMIRDSGNLFVETDINATTMTNSRAFAEDSKWEKAAVAQQAIGNEIVEETNIANTALEDDANDIIRRACADPKTGRMNDDALRRECHEWEMRLRSYVSEYGKADSVMHNLFEVVKEIQTDSDALRAEGLEKELNAKLHIGGEAEAGLQTDQKKSPATRLYQAVSQRLGGKADVAIPALPGATILAANTARSMGVAAGLTAIVGNPLISVPAVALYFGATAYARRRGMLQRDRETYQRELASGMVERGAGGGVIGERRQELDNYINEMRPATELSQNVQRLISAIENESDPIEQRAKVDDLSKMVAEVEAIQQLSKIEKRDFIRFSDSKVINREKLALNQSLSQAKLHINRYGFGDKTRSRQGRWLTYNAGELQDLDQEFKGYAGKRARKAALISSGVSLATFGALSGADEAAGYVADKVGDAVEFAKDVVDGEVAHAAESQVPTPGTPGAEVVANQNFDVQVPEGFTPPEVEVETHHLWDSLQEHAHEQGELDVRGDINSDYGTPMEAFEFNEQGLDYQVVDGKMEVHLNMSPDANVDGVNEWISNPESHRMVIYLTEADYQAGNAYIYNLNDFAINPDTGGYIIDFNQNPELRPLFNVQGDEVHQNFFLTRAAHYDAELGKLVYDASVPSQDVAHSTIELLKNVPDPTVEVEPPPPPPAPTEPPAPEGPPMPDPEATVTIESSVEDGDDFDWDGIPIGWNPRRPLGSIREDDGQSGEQNEQPDGGPRLAIESGEIPDLFPPLSIEAGPALGRELHPNEDRLISALSRREAMPLGLLRQMYPGLRENPAFSGLENSWPRMTIETRATQLQQFLSQEGLPEGAEEGAFIQNLLENPTPIAGELGAIATHGPETGNLPADTGGEQAAPSPDQIEGSEVDDAGTPPEELGPSAPTEGAPEAGPEAVTGSPDSGQPGGEPAQSTPESPQAVEGQKSYIEFSEQPRRIARSEQRLIEQWAESEAKPSELTDRYPVLNQTRGWQSYDWQAYPPALRARHVADMISFLPVEGTRGLSQEQAIENSRQMYAEMLEDNREVLSGLAEQLASQSNTDENLIFPTKALTARDNRWIEQRLALGDAAMNDRQLIRSKIYRELEKHLAKDSPEYKAMQQLVRHRLDEYTLQWSSVNAGTDANNSSRRRWLTQMINGGLFRNILRDVARAGNEGSGSVGGGGDEGGGGEGGGPTPESRPEPTPEAEPAPTSPEGESGPESTPASEEIEEGPAPAAETEEGGEVAEVSLGELPRVETQAISGRQEAFRELYRGESRDTLSDFEVEDVRGFLLGALPRIQGLSAAQRAAVEPVFRNDVESFINDWRSGSLTGAQRNVRMGRLFNGERVNELVALAKGDAAEAEIMPYGTSGASRPAESEPAGEADASEAAGGAGPEGRLLTREEAQQRIVDMVNARAASLESESGNTEVTTAAAAPEVASDVQPLLGIEGDLDEAGRQRLQDEFNQALNSQVNEGEQSYVAPIFNRGVSGMLDNWSSLSQAQRAGFVRDVVSGRFVNEIQRALAENPDLFEAGSSEDASEVIESNEESAEAAEDEGGVEAVAEEEAPGTLTERSLSSEDLEDIESYSAEDSLDQNTQNLFTALSAEAMRSAYGDELYSQYADAFETRLREELSKWGEDEYSDETARQQLLTEALNGVLFSEVSEIPLA